MHSTISKGTEIREQENLDIYLKWLATKIYKFINKDINYNELDNNVELVELKSVKNIKNFNDNDNDNDNDNELTIEIINNKELIEYNNKELIKYNNEDTINYNNVEYLN
jgi:ABC-type Zn2+ transport system substrate-binding protein/surface adhesin